VDFCHCGKEEVVGGDDNQHCWIEAAFLVEAEQAGEQANCSGADDSGSVFHRL
jgi:hypothetical protein